MRKLIRVLLTVLTLVVCLNVTMLNWQMIDVEDRVTFSEVRTAFDEEIIRHLSLPSSDMIQKEVSSVVKIEIFTGQIIMPAGIPNVATGSGVIIDSSGVILTVRHLAVCLLETQQASGCVELSDGKQLIITDFVIDPNADLALLKVDPNGTELVPAQLGLMPGVGDPVWLVGSPCHLSFLVSKGVISRVIPPTEVGNTIISDVTLNPGNSGGPLFDRQGRIVGIAQGFVSPGHFNIGLSFLVGVDTIRQSLPVLYQELLK